jgi:hypothetical protein
MQSNKSLWRGCILSNAGVFWINEARRGTIDLSTITNPGRQPDEGLAVIIAGKIDADPHPSLSARKLAHSFGIVPSIVCTYLIKVLEMKFQHLRWVPQTLTSIQKAARVEFAQGMLQELAKHEHTKFYFLFTRDEWRIFYAYDHRTMWVASWDDVDEIERRSHVQQKTMFTLFVNGTDDYKIVILPKR